MAYSTSSPPQLLVPSVGDRPAIWAYESADDDATVNGASYISDAIALGMKLGDLVYVYDTTTPKGSIHYVSTATATAVTLAFAAVA